MIGRALVLVALVVLVAFGALVSSPKVEAAGFLCAIKNPPLPLTYSIGRLSGRIETRCIRRIVGSLTAFACLQRYKSLSAPPETVVCRTSKTFYSTVSIAVAEHQCDHTRLIYFWRVTGWAMVSDGSLKVPYRSPNVSSVPVMEICF